MLKYYTDYVIDHVLFLFTEGDLMGEQECPYSVLDVASLIQSRYAYITGTCSYKLQYSFIQHSIKGALMKSP